MDLLRVCYTTCRGHVEMLICCGFVVDVVVNLSCCTFFAYFTLSTTTVVASGSCTTNPPPQLIELMEFEQLLDSFDLSYSLLWICCGFVDTTIWQVHNKSRHWSSICCVTCRTIYNTKYGGRAYSIDAVRRTSRVSSTAVSLDNKGRVLLTTRSKLPRWNFLSPQLATNFQTKVP